MLLRILLIISVFIIVLLFAMTRKLAKFIEEKNSQILTVQNQLINCKRNLLISLIENNELKNKVKNSIQNNDEVMQIANIQMANLYACESAYRELYNDCQKRV